MQLAFEAGLPEFEEAVENGEARRDVEVLPDISLEHRRVVGQVVKDLRRGQAVVGEDQGRHGIKTSIQFGRIGAANCAFVLSLRYRTVANYLKYARLQLR